MDNYEEEDDGKEFADADAYDDGLDEDEFGLPSLSTTRRKAKRIPDDKAYDPGGYRINGDRAQSLLKPIPTSRPRANSSDIAEERGPPNYPTAKKSEGKILRPQYKEILRGMCNVRIFLYLALLICIRPCELSPPDQPPITVF